MTNGQTPPTASYDQLVNMSRDELVAYFDAGGSLDKLLERGTVGRPSGLGSRPDDLPDAEPMVVTSVRLPKPLVDELDEIAGRDREGRSGLLRTAVQEYLQRRREQAR
jgi:hypothetical protein